MPKRTASVSLKMICSTLGVVGAFVGMRDAVQVDRPTGDLLDFVLEIVLEFVGREPLAFEIEAAPDLIQQALMQLRENAVGRVDGQREGGVAADFARLHQSGSHRRLRFGGVKFANLG